MGEHVLMEALLENGEAIVDALLADEVLKNIPIVGTAAKICRARDDIRTKILAAKLARFLQTLEKVTPEERERLRQKMVADPDEAKKVGEALLLVLDKITALDKAQLIAYVFIAYTLGHDRRTDFRRLVDAIDQAFMDDLRLLLDGDSAAFPRSKSAFMACLFRAGLTTIVGGQTDLDVGEIYYTISPLGKELFRAYSEGRMYCRDDTTTSKSRAAG